MDDDQICKVQIGRPLRAKVKVAHRCELQLPVVIEVPPFLDSGEPFPTRYWLSCPLAVRRISRLEAAGGVREMEALVKEDNRFREQLENAHQRYQKDRDAMIKDDSIHQPTGGVGGTKKGVKCLHAHFADWLVHHENPVGEKINDQVLPLNCENACVEKESFEHYVRSQAWYEPKL